MAAREFRHSASRLQAVKMSKRRVQKVKPADVPPPSPFAPGPAPQSAPAAAADPDPEPDVIFPPHGGSSTSAGILSFLWRSGAGHDFRKVLVNYSFGIRRKFLKAL